MIALCVVGNHVAEIWKHFDLGGACHGCVLKASRIETSFTINGNVYSETLKKVEPTRQATVVVLRRKREKR